MTGVIQQMMAHLVFHERCQVSAGSGPSSSSDLTLFLKLVVQKIKEEFTEFLGVLLLSLVELERCN